VVVEVARFFKSYVEKIREVPYERKSEEFVFTKLPFCSAEFILSR
jgi:hypothetical protein